MRYVDPESASRYSSQSREKPRPGAPYRRDHDRYDNRDRYDSRNSRDSRAAPRGQPGRETLDRDMDRWQHDRGVPAPKFRESGRDARGNGYERRVVRSPSPRARRGSPPPLSRESVPRSPSPTKARGEDRSMTPGSAASVAMDMDDE
jgi:hypothetical protein